MEVEDSYIYGEGRRGRGGGGHTFIGDGLVAGVAAEEGYSIRHLLGSEGRTFM